MAPGVAPPQVSLVQQLLMKNAPARPPDQGRLDFTVRLPLP